MESPTNKMKIVAPKRELLMIKGMMPSDVTSIKSLFQREGCLDSENLFDDQDQCIALDDIQTRLASTHKTNKKASADLLVVADGKKIILADAKFKVSKTSNLSFKEAESKDRGSKGIISTQLSYYAKFLLVFKKSILTPSAKNQLKRKFNESPKYDFLTATEFYHLFH